MDRTSKSRLKRCKRRFCQGKTFYRDRCFLCILSRARMSHSLEVYLAFSLAVTHQETRTTRQYVLSQVSTANSTSKTHKPTPVEVVDLLLPPHWLPRNKQSPTSVPSLTLPVLQFTLDQYKSRCLLEEDHRQPQPPFKIMLLFPNKIETEEEENMVTPTRMVCICTLGPQLELSRSWVHAGSIENWAGFQLPGGCVQLSATCISQIASSWRPLVGNVMYPKIISHRRGGLVGCEDPKKDAYRKDQVRS
ncbi:hypothetical protein C8J57DRAFT_1477452 [Mycena rebaudengoi]|nr:hypothetical protein C8J57DRAFT_1477452 [Mycena rebaudengoi]